MKILIIEDELPAADYLKKKVTEIDPAANVLAVCKTVTETVQWISNNPAPDIIFMDIELADGKSFKIFDHVSIKSAVIFITAYDAYAIKAIKLNALDYLLKPVNKEELKAAMIRAREHNANKNNDEAFAELKTLVSGMAGTAKPKKLAVSTINGTIFIFIDDIVRLEAESSYTNIYLSNGQKLMASRTLKEFEEMLVDSGFYRVHNSHLVNLAHITRYIKGDGGTIVLSNSDNIEVSRQKKKGLMDILAI